MAIHDETSRAARNLGPSLIGVAIARPVPGLRTAATELTVDEQQLTNNGSRTVAFEQCIGKWVEIDSTISTAWFIDFGGGTVATRRFHRAVIEGMEFYAIMSVEGPYVATEPPGGGVALGRCTSICFLETPGFDSRNRQPHWVIVKYGDQERIDLSGLSQNGRKQLSQEFGIPICEPGSYGAEDEFFCSSAAFRGLCEWARNHPRLYTQYSRHQDYLPDWPKMVAETLGNV